MVDLSNTLLTQIVSSFVRMTVEVPANGSVVIYQSKPLVREASLRAMQAILVFMGLVSGICCMLLMPRSGLSEDPTTIGAVSVLLSRSDDAVRRKLREVASLDASATAQFLAGWRWKLSGF